MPPRILVVEDEAVWSDLIQDILQKKGYRVTIVDGADKALHQLRTVLPDAMILDINLKGLSGIKLCEYIRADPKTMAVPILMLTALKSEKDKVRGLEIGADDYLGKPFGHEELAARVLALLRRSRGLGASDRLQAGALAVDLDRHEVFIKGKAVELRPKEFELLALLMRQKGKVLRKEFLAEAVWGKDLIVTSQTLAQHIKNLRAKLGSCADYIQTVETLGYKFLDK